jgi:tetratricopeptide (TPR) repeat protein
VLLEATRLRTGSSAAVYATLAEAYAWKYNESTDKQWLPKAVEFGRQAVRITDALADGHVALGMALAASGQRTEAIHEFDRAIDLNPRTGPLHRASRLRSEKKRSNWKIQRLPDLSPGQWIPERTASFLP